MPLNNGCHQTKKQADAGARKIRCAWEGCWRSTTNPGAGGWAYLCEWPSPIKDGLYCRQHWQAIEAVEERGGFYIGVRPAGAKAVS
jgi:hypothetical protein